MTSKASKPGTAALLPAAAVPLSAALGTLIAADIACGDGYASLIAALIGIPALMLAAVAFLLAALVVGLWRGSINVRRWVIACAVLNALAFGGVVASELSGMHSPSACRFDM
jgi:uncharacterized membrane protein